jgi:NADP-dependent 3-hydroxy acid dehydrogenase YdfG
LTLFDIRLLTNCFQGASSGIGKATAILFSNLGSKLVLSGRNEQALNETIDECNPQMKLYVTISIPFLKLISRFGFF